MENLEAVNGRGAGHAGARAWRVVIDTNTVIDLLHFADPSTEWLRVAIADGRVRCFTGAECLAELASVLPRAHFRLDAAGVERVLAAYGDFVTVLAASTCCAGAVTRTEFAATAAPTGSADSKGLADPTPVSAAIAALPRCRDRDDQKFLVAAAQCAADLLITRDKELLRLARPGRRTPLPFAVLGAAAAEGWLAAQAEKELGRSAH